MNNKIKLGILRNELEDDHSLWIMACEDYAGQVEYDVIDLTSHDWFEKITKTQYDYLLAKPPILTAGFKQLFDERIFIIDTVLKIPIYPSPSEIYIYENKRFLYSWLKANNLPHPKTDIFYSKTETLEFLNNIKYPIVVKYNIGASGSGVQILNGHADSEDYISKAFSSDGAPRRWGPNIDKNNSLKRIYHYVKNPSDISKKLNIYKSRKNDAQKGFVIVQEYIPHDYEWRIVAIGDSYFAHKKVKVGEKASGSLVKKYDNPPIELFYFAKDIMDKFGFYSQAIDVFELKDGQYLINEMQCIFGQSDSFQMLVNNVPGRYRYINNKWIFEEGDFNINESFNLRIAHILTLLAGVHA